MSTVRSADGTTIAFDRTGSGPPLILVGGAFSYRRWKGFVELAELLSERFMVISYDRRGRGDSGDAPAYAVEREIEDLAAVIQAASASGPDEGVAGGRAHVFGMSSRGVLALRAHAAGVAIDRLVLYQPPLIVDQEGHVPPPDFARHLERLVSEGRRSAAASYFMRQGMGAPGPFVRLLRLARPIWSSLQAVAHTLPYDFAVMGETVTGKPLAREPWSSITAPTLVVAGSKSPPSLRKASDALVTLMPDAQRRILQGQSHNVSMKALAPVVQEFLGR